MHLLLALLACGAPESPSAAPAAAVAPAPSSAPSAPSAPSGAVEPVAAGPRVVFLGDSLTAGLGLPADDAFPAQVARALAAEGRPVTLVNAGVSGDTSAGGLRRIDWILTQKPDVVVLALGANDMLRGLPPADCAKNLRAIVEKARAAGADVLLLGMRANPTLGPAYVAEFDAIYPAIAKELGVPLVPFLLEGVAGDVALNQADGLHPTREGHARIAALVAPVLAPIVAGRGE